MAQVDVEKLDQCGCCGAVKARVGKRTGWFTEADYRKRKKADDDRTDPPDDKTTPPAASDPDSYFS